MPIYTKSGDTGKTYLANGSKVPKNHYRVELYGCVDKLNSYIGLAIAQLKMEGIEALGAKLLPLQHQLFELGSELAAYEDEHCLSGKITDEEVNVLEKEMDFMELQVGPMNHFILPGGSLSSSTLHIARTICRDLERKMTTTLIQYENKDEEGKAIMKGESYKYINRLSDYLFMCARYSNFLNKQDDVPWIKK